MRILLLLAAVPLTIPQCDRTGSNGGVDAGSGSDPFHAGYDQDCDPWRAIDGGCGAPSFDDMDFDAGSSAPIRCDPWSTYCEPLFPPPAPPPWRGPEQPPMRPRDAGTPASPFPPGFNDGGVFSPGDGGPPWRDGPSPADCPPDHPPDPSDRADPYATD